MRIRRKNQSGAAMTEVAILLSLITCAVLIGLDLVSDSTNKSFCESNLGFMASGAAPPAGLAAACADVWFLCDINQDGLANEKC